MSVLNVSSRLHWRIANHPARADRGIGEFTTEILEAYLNSPQMLIEELQGENAALQERRAILDEKLADASKRIEILERRLAGESDELSEEDLSDRQDTANVT